MSEHNQNLQVAIAALATCQKTVNEALLNTPFSNIQIRCEQSLNMLLNIIKHMTGQEIEIEGTNQNTEFEPLTHFMGEKLEKVKEFKPEEIKPVETEVEIFKGKVLKLYDDFGLMDNDTILKTYVGEQTVIRGVAKKAGLEDYTDAELTFEYLEAIRTAMAGKASLKETENTVELEKLKGDLAVAEKEVERLDGEWKKEDAELTRIKGDKKLKALLNDQYKKRKEVANALTTAKNKVIEISKNIESITNP